MTTMCPVCRRQIPDGTAVCPYCSYRLMDSTQSFRPLPENISLDEVIQKPKAECSLYIAKGPQIGTLIPLKTKKATVGRSPSCDILLNDMTVSREHALIQPDTKGGFRITDLESFNGIWINNKNVNSVHLNNGDIIQIGVFCLVYKEVEK